MNTIEPVRSDGTLHDAAELLGVSIKTIRRYIDAGLIEADRVGPRLIRVRLDTLPNALTPIEGGQR